MSRDEIDEAGYEAVFKSSGCDVMRKLCVDEPSNPVDKLNPLFRFKDLRTGGVVQVQGIKYEVSVSRLCDACEDSTNLLNIADGLNLCPECSKSLDKRAKIGIQAENLGIDVEELAEYSGLNSQTDNEV